MNNLEKRVIKQYLENRFDIDKMISEIEQHITDIEKITDERVKQIICIIEDYLKIDLFERTRKFKIVFARQLAIYFIRITDIERIYNLKQIGQMFPSPDRDGFLDHSSVTHAIKHINDLIETDAKFRADFEAIKQLINTLNYEIQN
jgi:chromosomal replication initiation ATPase DnaA